MTLYLGKEVKTCGAEVFGETGVARLCPAVCIGIVRATEDLALLDLRGDGALRIGATQALATGREERHATQEWARAIYEQHPGGPDTCGIIYPSAYSGGDCLASIHRE